MVESAKWFLNYLDEHNIVYEYFERNRKSDLVSLGYRLDNGKAAEILVFFEHDNLNVAMRCYTDIRFPPDQRGKMLEFVNTLTPAYRCTKLYLDEGEVVIGCDMLLPDGNCGAFLAKYLDLFLFVANETYNRALKLLI